MLDCKIDKNTRRLGAEMSLSHFELYMLFVGLSFMDLQVPSSRARCLTPRCGVKGVR